MSNNEVWLMNLETGIRASSQSSCFLCGSGGLFVYERLTDRLFDAPGMWGFRRCKNPDCGLVWLDPMPLEEDLSKAYETYYTHGEEQGIARDSIDLSRFVKTGVERIYNLLLWTTTLGFERHHLNLMYLHRSRPGRLLEIGCGNGQRLALLKELGWTVEGQEVDAKAAAVAQAASGVTIHVGALRALPLAEHTFDAIVMNHVIEHVHDPTTLMARCRELLKPDGQMMLVTPNIRSYGHRQFGRSWLGIDPPRHLHLFSTETLTAVAKKAGFSVCDAWTTAANAQTVAVGSLGIMRRGRHSLATGSGLRTHLSAALFQLWARLAFARDPASGEECVLRAKR